MAAPNDPIMEFCDFSKSYDKTLYTCSLTFSKGVDHLGSITSDPTALGGFKLDMNTAMAGIGHYTFKCTSATAVPSQLYSKPEALIIEAGACSMSYVVPTPNSPYVITTYDINLVKNNVLLPGFSTSDSALCPMTLVLWQGGAPYSGSVAAIASNNVVVGSSFGLATGLFVKVSNSVDSALFDVDLRLDCTPCLKINIAQEYKRYASRAEDLNGTAIITNDNYVSQSKFCSFQSFELLKDKRVYLGKCVQFFSNGKLAFTGVFCNETNLSIKANGKQGTVLTSIAFNVSLGINCTSFLTIPTLQAKYRVDVFDPSKLVDDPFITGFLTEDEKKCPLQMELKQL